MGCAFDAITAAEAVDRVFEWRDARERRSHVIATVDIATLMDMRDDRRLTHAVDRADVVVMGGQPLVWTARWLHSAAPENVSAVVLMQRLLRARGHRRLSMYLLGGTQERLDALQRVILQKHPNVRLAGARNGYFLPSQSAEVVRGVREAQADVLLVGLPAPFQEIWCEEHRDDLETPAIVCVGSAFDVVGGFAPRGPHVIQGLKRYVATHSSFLALLPRALAEGRRPQQRV
jgi:N-acetylglucosaminyldiphosphoundecaprenol N-acetyl-beta-D-mannosaminyltransferase